MTSEPLDESAQDYVAARRAEAEEQSRLIRRLHYAPLGDDETVNAFACSQGNIIQFGIPSVSTALIGSPAHIVSAVFCAALGESAAAALAQASSVEAGEYRTRLFADAREIPETILSVGRIVFDTPETLALMQRTLGRIEDPLALSAARILEVAATLEFSSRFPTITGYLDLCHYLPANLSAKNTTAIWGLYAPECSPLPLMQATQFMWEAIRAANGKLSRDEYMSAPLPVSTRILARGFYGSESSALGGAQFRSVKAGFSVSRGVESVSRYIDGLRALDPLDRDYALRFGSVVRVGYPDLYLGTTKGELTWIDGACSFKSGERVTLRSTRSPREVKLRVSRVVGSGEELCIEVQKDHDFTEKDVEDFGAAVGHDVLLMKQVFGVFSSRRLRGRFMPGGDRTITPRAMPADLAALTKGRP